MNTKTQATLNTEEYGQIPAGEGQISLTSNAPNELKYQASMSQGGMAVFSEIYYPKGWTATIDGKEAPILRVNYLLRGLEIPAGKHEVVFTFAPSSYYSTKTPMVIFQYLIVLTLIAGVFFNYKKSNGKV
ncbi:YfhO family protein [Algoriphagus boritolerans]|uniref:YfhO family protein n=1 Tax=Algoriphagus boritolerans TaxID=308111 RepID=UPI003A100398